MTLGEYITNNNVSKISVVIGTENINNKKVFNDIYMIPIKYWNSEIKTFRHSIDYTGVNPIEIIAVIKLT